jgi:hypothetical protein
MPTKRKVVGSWPHFYATIWLLCHRSRERIFVISREATKSTFFMLYRDERTTIIQFSHRIARASDAMTHNAVFFMSYRD